MPRKEGYRGITVDMNTAERLFLISEREGTSTFTETIRVLIREYFKAHDLSLQITEEQAERICGVWDMAPGSALIC